MFLVADHFDCCNGFVPLVTSTPTTAKEIGTEKKRLASMPPILFVCFHKTTQC